jgi:hypothetical protein
MGGSHAHSSHGGDAVATAYLPRLVLLVALAVAALATVIGVVAMWPDGDRPAARYAAEGVTFPEATVVKVNDPCPVIFTDPTAPPTEPPVQPPENCGKVQVEFADGGRQLVGVPPLVAESGLRKGDTIQVVRVPPTADVRDPAPGYFGTVRDRPLGLLLAAFVLVVALVARLRGLLALVGLGFAGWVVWVFMLPALLEGTNGAAIAVVGSSAIMFVVLYLAHGPTVRTSTALAGTLVGLGLAAGLGAYAIGVTRLGGGGEVAGSQLYVYAPDLDFRGLLLSALIVGGLGVLNDVTITQSSAVWELRAAGPELTRRQLFVRGMRIGRDHIASTIYTIVFAFCGTALSLLLLTAVYGRSLAELRTDEGIAETIVVTLVAGIALMLAMPITTAIAAGTVSGPTGRDGTSATPR